MSGLAGGGRWLAACLVAVGMFAATPAGAAPLAAPMAAPVAATSVRNDAVADRQAQVDQTTAELDALSAQAGVALEQYQNAVRAQYQAQVDELFQQEQLIDSEAAWRKSGAELGRWAHLAYQNGGAAGEISSLLALVQSRSPADVSRNLVTLRNVSGDMTVVLQHADATRRLHALRTASVQAASARALDAAGQAALTRQASQALVQAQQATLQTLTALLQEARTVADNQARAATMRAAAASAVRSSVIGCGGVDSAQFPNGMIPAEALCPLASAPGHQLRADAAMAFGNLSQAFAAEHGTPICVTDSYRSFSEQVSVYAAKPALAAQPGTSNHGWGVAVDLCGGIQTFGTEQHLWLLRNAPVFGWFHPQWARQGGSKPEAWHWEFAG